MFVNKHDTPADTRVEAKNPQATRLAALCWKGSEVRSFHLRSPDRLADASHFVDVFEGVHLLHVRRLGIFQRLGQRCVLHGFLHVRRENIQAFAGKVGIVTNVGEKLRHVADTLPDHCANLAIERLAGQASPKELIVVVGFGKVLAVRLAPAAWSD
jgi:hypothetical protein